MGTTAANLGPLACSQPQCELGALAGGDKTLRCGKCGRAFPVFNCAGQPVAWMFDDAEAALAQWRARYRGFSQQTEQECARLEAALGASDLSGSAAVRIETLLSARNRQRRTIDALLAPFGLGEGPASAATPNQVAKKQGLLSYHDNVFRDWSWGNGEAEALWQALAAVIPSDATLGTALTLGAGAGRLSYDLHRFGGADCSVLLDINPLLLAVAAFVIGGEKVALPEFPLAPLDAPAIDRTCAAPEEGVGPFQFVLGDASRPPFEPSRFDTVLTPWLIDVLGEDPHSFFARINGLLRDGGLWLNTGTLFYDELDPLRRYSEPEVLEIVEASGFELIATDRREVDYLSSPASAHGRRERVTSFSARKLRSIDKPGASTPVPRWLTDTALPVPKPTELAVAAAERLLQAQVLAAVDGERSVAAIAALLARQYDLPLADATEAVRQILQSTHDSLGR